MDHAYFMKLALMEAQLAMDEGEIPVGAIIVCNGRIIAKGHNLTEKLNDPTAHAEIQAITAATQFLGSKYLKNCTLYVTLEPCVMCAGALYWSQIETVVYGASDEKRGFSILAKTALHPKTTLVGGILENECSILLKEFFKLRRQN
ncbi:MAG TPA: tRNA-specific adenosine deaminase [Bacteroidales bacterium]|nr:tRNA-specific adenosine deaminase [Bacteroidales bacterium]